MSKKLTTSLTGFGAESGGYEEAMKLLHGLGYCSAGEYPWDYWERAAVAAGVSGELASLGRAVMREAWQHDWSERLQGLCGWGDAGKRMIGLALRAPESAKKRWGRLLERDGGRWQRETQSGWRSGEKQPNQADLMQQK